MAGRRLMVAPPTSPPRSVNPFAMRRFGSGGPTLADVGEAALLERLTRLSDAQPGVIVASGDDAAVWRPSPGGDVVITQDAMVEGEDFRRSWITPFRLGGRLLTISLSDLAAMGATPGCCLATLCAPDDTQLDDVLAIQNGIRAVAARWGCPLVGGDVSRTSGPLVLDLTALGTVGADRVLRRDVGRPGQLLGLTGTLGEAAAGLRLLLADPSATGRCVDSQLDARARVDEGRAMAALGVRCAGDLSDGLWVDAGRIAQASGCGAELWRDALPVSDEVRAVAGDAAVDLALGGGEDFELLFAVDPELLVDLQLRGWPSDLAPVTVVGRLTEARGVRLLDSRDGEPMTGPAVLSRHFG